MVHDHHVHSWRRCWQVPCHTLLALLAGLVARGEEPAAQAAGLAESKRWVIAADFAPDGASLLTAGGESLLYRPGDVVLWNPADGSRLADLGGHETAVWAAKWTCSIDRKSVV